ncbi:hypothetical protein NDU88_005664 [Pleurodeles waltl]|uniref:Uncharacterized protein n=1 Tax=Pleurodeles waltl TaxID=8319 RepID=A0AAV7UJF7_PLEWA|nr:hypothetical protein NDU88_005664 [Pleurodeles waltl]
MTSRGWPFKVAVVGERVFLALADPTRGPQLLLQHFREEEDNASGTARLTRAVRGVREEDGGHPCAGWERCQYSLISP